MRALHRFDGGVHPPEHKAESTGTPIATAPIPAQLIVSLRQHNITPAKPIVAPGDRVLKGQMIGRAEGFISAAVHAPTSGTVSAIEMRPVAHPSGLPDLCVVIEADGEDRWIEHGPIDYCNTDPAALRNYLRDSGVVGLGGAVFPAHIKLNPGPHGRIRTLILNGAECEPWITCDDMLMRERAGEIVQGIAVMRHMMCAEEVLIGIEDNKPQAIEAMRAACQGTSFEVVPVPTLYPSGSAKQLIQILTGKETPAGKLPTDIGVQCFNVGTAYTLHRAIHFGEPVISRIVTITGNVSRPQNFEALIGTPVAELVAVAGGAAPDTNRYIMGGPMMGFPLPEANVPLAKSTNCVIAASDKLFPPLPAPLPCIRCGRCAQACPVDLQPMELYWFARGNNFDKAKEYSLFDCIECGCCSYVCPSHIPLVQYYRYAKSEISVRDKESKAADHARERHEFREYRKEREQQEKAARLAEKRAAPAAADQSADDKKAAIQAAVERAKAKKAAAQAGAAGDSQEPPSPPLQGEG